MSSLQFRVKDMFVQVLIRSPTNCNLAKASHYENTPMQYTVIFHSRKNDNFQMKNYDIFLISAQNIDGGHTLELPQ